MTSDGMAGSFQVIACRGLTKHYVQGNKRLMVLDDLDFALGQGESVAIIGASGSGKTTLLNLLGGLDNADTGTAFVCGSDFGPMNESQRARWRNRNLGFVYQFHHLLGEFSALENVMMPLLIGRVSKKEAKSRAAIFLERVGLSDRLNHRPHQLSGGERQRVAIARALVTEPACVLMDEPTGNLDPDTAGAVLRLLESLKEEIKTACIIVTHDYNVASRMDKVLKLFHGKLVSHSDDDV